MTPTRWRRLRHQLRTAPRDRGASTLALVIMTAAILMAIALISDGAEKIRAARTATTIAQEAARAAGQELSGQAITAGTTTLDSARAGAAARAYLAATGTAGTVTITGDTVTVTTQVTWQPRFLAAISSGGTLTGTGTAKATR